MDARLEFILAVRAHLWESWRIIATDTDEQSARNYWNAGLRGSVEVANIIARNHGIQST